MLRKSVGGLKMVNHRIMMNPGVFPVGKNRPDANPSSNKAADRQFEQVLAQQLQTQTPLKFSQHARQRLQSRNIHLSEGDMTQLEQAIGKVAQKGARDSLILMQDKNVAFVVSVKNNTVITAMDGQNLKENVFTNIDSAVIT